MLKLQHAEALVEWITAGGLNVMKAQDPAVTAAREKIAVAAQAVIEHREAHGC